MCVLVRIGCRSLLKRLSDPTSASVETWLRLATVELKPVGLGLGQFCGRGQNLLGGNANLALSLDLHRRGAQAEALLAQQECSSEALSVCPQCL